MTGPEENGIVRRVDCKERECAREAEEKGRKVGDKVFGEIFPKAPSVVHLCAPLQPPPLSPVTFCLDKETSLAVERANSLLAAIRRYQRQSDPSTQGEHFSHTRIFDRSGKYSGRKKT